jgi:hypothetical protein
MTNPTWPDLASNLDLHEEMLAINHLSQVIEIGYISGSNYAYTEDQKEIFTSFC